MTVLVASASRLREMHSARDFEQAVAARQGASSREPPRLIGLIYWPCLLLSILLLVGLPGAPPEQQGAVLGVGLMMAACALGICYVQTAEDQQVIVTPFGLVHRRPNGKRVGSCWCRR